MRNPLLRGSFWAAVVIAVGLAGPASAQVRHGGWGNSGYGYGDEAYRNGYTAGQREGERDARDRKDYGFKRDNAYERGDWGYRGGNKNDYKRAFRRGYEEGYASGYRRYAGSYGGGYGGGYGRPNGSWGGGPAWSRNGGGYDGYRNDRLAFRNGYNDGYKEGSEAARRNRRYDPTGEGRYRDGDRGYNRSYGSRDAYRADYRVGFRQGYDEGYRGGRRW